MAPKIKCKPSKDLKVKNTAARTTTGKGKSISKKSETSTWCGVAEPADEDFSPIETLADSSAGKGTTATKTLAEMCIGKACDRPAKKKRQQLERRDSDEKAERKLEEKLGARIDQSWRSKVSAKGVKISDYTKQAIKKLAPTGPGSKLSTKFWTKLFREFALLESAADGLEPPPSGYEIDPDLLEALEEAHSGNPAGQPASVLERYLENCHELNPLELHGLFNAIAEAPDLPTPVSMRCHVATLRYICRTSGAGHISQFHC